jgi:hypothetical protein
MKNNRQLTPSFKKALEKLNALPRKAGKGRELTQADLISLDQAKELAPKKEAFLNPELWDEGSVFVKVDTMVELYRTLTPDGKESLAHDEILGGWFEGDGDCEDDDGEFCSTPCHDEEVPTIGEFRDSLENCATYGELLFIY